MKIIQNLLAAIFLLTLLPASASAVSFSNLDVTSKSFSVDISGDLPGSEPLDNSWWIIITHPTLNTAPGFVLENFASAATASFSGSQTVDYFKTGTEVGGDYLWVQFNSFLSASEGLNGTLSGTWSSNVFNPGEASTVNFYWGTGGSGAPNSGIPLGSASLSVPDTGSTAVILGAGVVALAFARRRLV